MICDFDIVKHDAYLQFGPKKEIRMLFLDIREGKINGMFLRVMCAYQGLKMHESFSHILML